MLCYRSCGRAGSPVPVALLGLVCGAAWPAGSAGADVVTAFYNNDFHFSYHVTHMPDLDQWRLGLPGNGQFHCVPAATLNLLIYAANHGFDDVQPGPGNWQSPGAHNVGTSMIDTMAQFMGTTFTPANPNTVPPTPASGGTSADGGDAGLAQWLGPWDYFVINNFLAAPNFTINFNNIAKSVISGNIGTMSYGRYDVMGTAPGDIPILRRRGGHATTIVRCYRNGDDMQIWVRDPADSNDSLSLQSPFVNRVWQVMDLPVLIMNPNDPEDLDMRFMSALNYDATQNTVRLIDGHRTIRPKMGFSFSPSQNSLGVHAPITFGGVTVHPPVPAPGPIVSASFHGPHQEFLLVAGDRITGLYRVNPHTGDSEQVDLPGQPSLVHTIGNGRTFVITRDNMLHRLSPALVSERSALLAHAVVDPGQPTPLGKLAHDPGDPGTREPAIVVASMIERAVMRYPLDLYVPLVHEIPSAIPGSLLDMAVEPATGRLWLCMSDSNTLYGLLMNADGTLDVENLIDPSIVEPSGIDFDDAGNLMVCGQDVMSVLGRDANDRWSVKLDSPFHGTECLGEFTMMRISSNYDPEHHDHESWSSNIEPELLVFGEAVADCNGDLVVNNVVDVLDMLTLLESWGTCVGCAADLNHDDVVNVGDLLLLLESWGACP